MDRPPLQSSTQKDYDKDSKRSISDMKVGDARASQRHTTLSLSPRRRRKSEEVLIRSSVSFLRDFDDTINEVDIPKLLKEHHTTLRFPEKLLLLIVQAEREALTNGRSPDSASLAWTFDGQALVIRNTNELLHKLLPLAGCQAKYMSFRRALYRWGFRQIKEKSSANNNSKKSGECVFHHHLFRRDNKPLMVGMRSVTAEGTRRALSTQKLVEQQEATLSHQYMNRAPSNTSDFHPQGLQPTPFGFTGSGFVSSSSLAGQQVATAHPTLFGNPPQFLANTDIGRAQFLDWTTSHPHHNSAMNQAITQIRDRASHMQVGYASLNQASTPTHINHDATFLMRSNFPDVSFRTRMFRSSSGAFEDNLPNGGSVLLWQQWPNLNDGNQGLTRGK